MIRATKLSIASIFLISSLGPTARAQTQCTPAWDGSIGVPAFNNVVQSLTVFDDGGGSQLYAGGSFTGVGATGAKHVARWDGSAWSALDTGVTQSGISGTVLALSPFSDGAGGRLCAAGIFDTAGGVPAANVAQWSGSSWSAMGDGFNNTVYALARNNGELYAAGNFTTSGPDLITRIAEWSGSDWTPLAAGFNSFVFALASFDDGSGGGPELCAGGQFSLSGTTPIKKIAQWNGLTWSPLGDGLDNSFGNAWVAALAVYDDGSGSGPELYAGGNFTLSGTTNISHVAKWNGSAWLPLGSGVNGFLGVTALAVYDDGSGSGPELYAGGDFTVAGGVSATFVAKWNGTSWSSPGTGVDLPVYALETFDDGAGASLYAGGQFQHAGGMLAGGVAEWHGTPPTPASASFRNGSGVNPAGFAQVTPSVIGTNWNVTVDVVTPPNVYASIVVAGLGGPTQVSTGFGELLCLPPYFKSVAFGAHSIPIPNDCGSVGMVVCTQAATLAPGDIRLQNALDITIGTF